MPMKAPIQQPGTRSHVIQNHVIAYTRSGASFQTYAQNVAETYNARVRPEHREIDFKADGDPIKCIEANAQKVARYFDPAVNARLPVDLEEACVLALPEPFRGRCLADLAARYGLLAVPIPTGESADARKVAQMMTECGEAVTELVPCIEDGAIGPEDGPRLHAAARQLLELMAAAADLLQTVREAKVMARA